MSATAFSQSAIPGAPDLVFRPGRTEDAACLSALAVQVFLATYAKEGIYPSIAREALAAFTPARFMTALDDPGTRIVVAESLGNRVGFAQVTLGASHAQVPCERPSELQRLYLLETFTGQHVGRALLAEAERAAAEAGTVVLWLKSWIHNHRALRFYERCGYADHGATWFDLEGELHENRVYARRLGTPRPVRTQT